jgi:hypothetical protein
MELSPPWEATDCAAAQKLPSILWNPKIYYRVHKSPPLVPILSHINPIHAIPSYLSTFHFNSVHSPTSWSSEWSISFWLSHRYLICIPLLPIRAICPAHQIVTHIQYKRQARSSLASTRSLDSLDTQHNRKSHPAPGSKYIIQNINTRYRQKYWHKILMHVIDTRARLWDCTSQTGSTAVSANNLLILDDDQCRLKHVVHCTENLKYVSEGCVASKTVNQWHQLNNL